MMYYTSFSGCEIQINRFFRFFSNVLQGFHQGFRWRIHSMFTSKPRQSRAFSTKPSACSAFSPICIQQEHPCFTRLHPVRPHIFTSGGSTPLAPWITGFVSFLQAWCYLPGINGWESHEIWDISPTKTIAIKLICTNSAILNAPACRRPKLSPFLWPKHTPFITTPCYLPRTCSPKKLGVSKVMSMEFSGC